MRYLALDIGTRRTGVAFLDTEVGVPLPLDTIEHQSAGELLTNLLRIIRERNIERVIVGLPRLPSGSEGSQAEYSRNIGALIAAEGVPVEYIDERYTTPRLSSHTHALPTRKIDGDAGAACALISLKLDH